MDIDYVAERIKSIESTEKRLVDFLDGVGHLVDTIHEAHINNTNDSIDKEKEIKNIVNTCYDDISYASVHLRRELKLLDIKLPLPPNLSKKASDLNNEKLKQLLNDKQ
jgi:hypothetical protein